MAAHTGAGFARAALKYQGVPYVWGGHSPKGFDCSGLVYYVLGQMGVPIGRTSEQQYADTKRVAPGNLKPGDLVFLNFPGEVSPGHVMIWMGSNTVLQAPSAGQKVQLSHFDPQKPGTNEWGATVVGYGRIPGLHTAGEPSSVVTPSQVASTGIGVDVSSGSIGNAVSSVGSAAHAAAAPFESAYAGITSFADAIKFIFSIRGLETLGGGILMLMGIYLLVRQVGLAADVPVPSPVKAAALAVPAARKVATKTRRAPAPSAPSYTPSRRQQIIHRHYPVGSPEAEAHDRASRARPISDPATNEIPF